MKTVKWKVRMCTALLTICFLVPLSMATSNNETNISSNDSSNITNISSDITNITYQVEVDQDYGFYRVFDRTAHRPMNYTNKTININVGDTVIWVNDATPDESLTIISEQGLWENKSAYLRWNYQKFNYTFNKSGTYTFYVREYKRLQHQTIIVQDISPEKPISTITVISTPTKTYTPESTINNTATQTVEKPKKGPVSGITAVIALLIIYLYLKRRK